MTIMTIHLIPEDLLPEKEESAKSILFRSQACDLLKDAIKNETDSVSKYTKIKESMPIVYMGYYTDIDIIRANRGRDKIRLMEISKKIECPP